MKETFTKSVSLPSSKLRKLCQLWKMRNVSVYGGSVAYESVGKVSSFLAEAQFLKGTFKEYDLQGVPLFFNPAQTEDFLSGSVTLYWGHTFNRKKRLQIPVYLGVGSSYVYGGSVHNITGDVAAKLRVKFYVNNHLVIYVGGNGRYGMGWRGHKDDATGLYEDFRLDNVQFNADAGVVISF